MKSPHPFLLLAGGLGVLLAGSPGSSGTAPLHAASSSFTLWADTDQDGLDDALETRFGLSHTLADTDADGYTDFEEVLAGMDPLAPSNLNLLTNLDPKLTLEVYTIGQDTVITVTAMRRYTAKHFKLLYATRDQIKEVPLYKLGAYANDTRTIATTIPGMTTTVSRVTLPTAVFERAPALALAVQAELDGHLHGSEVSLTMVDGLLMEYRTSLSMSRPASNQNQGGQTGGLFPTDGGADLPGEVSAGKVCVQELNEIGSLGLGSGQKIYQVSNGYCDILPTAKCFSTCSDTIGGTIIGIDIGALLGG